MDKSDNGDASIGATAVYGLSRGLMTGFAWGITVDPVWRHQENLYLKSVGLDPLPKLSLRQQTLELGRTMGIFGVFVGINTGVACICREIRGEDDWRNSGVGGAAAGAFIARHGGRRHIATIAVGGGCLSAFVRYLAS